MTLGTGRTIAIVLGALSALLVQPARAQDAPSFDDALARANKHVRRGKWKSAKKAFEGLFVDFENDPRVLAEMDGIEEGYRRSLFMSAYKQPSPQQVLGRAVKKYNRTTRQARFEFDRVVGGIGAGAGAKIKLPARINGGWQAVGDNALVFDVVFENEVELEFSSSAWIGVALFYEPDSGTGYFVYPGYFMTTEFEERWLDKLVFRLDEGEKKQLFRKSPDKGSRRGSARISKKGSTITAKRGSKTLFRVTDKKYVRGYVAILLPEEGVSKIPFAKVPRGVTTLRSVRLTGKVDEGYYRKRAGALEAEAFERWLRDEYRRDSVLPAWARKKAPPSETTLLSLPSDAPPERRVLFQRAVELFHSGRHLLFLVLYAGFEESSGSTWRYLTGLRDLATGAYAHAEFQFDRLAKDEPQFAPAFTGLALAQLGLHREEEARESLARARKLDERFPPTYAALVDLAIYDGDLEAAERTVTAALAKGVVTDDLRRMKKWLGKAKRGPSWSKRFDHSTRHFDIASDHSKKMCVEVGRILQASLTAYSAHFATMIRKKSARVYVFADRTAYDAYLEGLALRAENTAGVYIPILRELVIWVTDNRTQMWRTTKHEAFHQYLHNFLQDAPIWMNEGFAEYFGFARYEKGHLVMGRPPLDQRILVQRHRSGFAPLEEFLVMDSATFMAKPQIHYTQAWALVQYLRHEAPREYKNLIPDYFALLRQGKSAAEAYEAVFHPVLKSLQLSFTSYAKRQ